MPVFSVGSVDIHISDLDVGLDDAFVRLYASRLGHTAFPQSTFDAAASAFLKSTADPHLHDRYFSNFTPLWRLHWGAATFEKLQKSGPGR